MKNAVLTLIMLTIWYGSGVPAQTITSKEYLQWHARAVKLYNLDEPTIATDSQSLHLFSIAATGAIQNADLEKAADCLIKAGNIHQTYQRFPLSNTFYHQALDLIKHTNKYEQQRYEIFLYLGSSCYFSSIIDSARQYFEQASAIAVNNRGTDYPEEERLYNSLGAIYFESANYQQAQNYFEKALLVAASTAIDYDESFVAIRSNIANCLLRLNHFESALQIYKTLPGRKMSKDLAEIIKQNTAHTYFELGKYDSALKLYKQLDPGVALNRIKALNDVGRIYMNRQEWQQAEVVFDSAIAENRRISRDIKNKEEALAYLYRGQLAAKQGLTDEAITWCNEALQEIYIDFNWKASTDLPENITATVSPVTAFEVLRIKAGLLYQKYQQGSNPAHLNSALRGYGKAIETANFIRHSFDNDEAKLFFHQHYRDIYDEAVNVAFHSYQQNNSSLNDYIFILENYKGNILQQNLQDILLKSNSQIPDSVKTKEKEIKQLLAFYTSRVNSSASEKDALELQGKLLGLQIDLSRLQKMYEQDGSYKFSRYQSSRHTLDIEKIRKNLNNSTALINFYITDSAAYVLAINNKSERLHRIDNNTRLQNQLQSFLKEVVTHDEGRRYNGIASSADLYQQLLAPVSDIIEDREQWVIIPDGMLHYLPVEALSRKADSPDYIAMDKIVSYHYSFTLLFQENTYTARDKKNRQTLAFAPYNNNDQKLLPTGLPFLPHSNTEVTQPGMLAVKGAEATKQRFIEQSADHPVIHLATHASTGTDSAANWIQFYPSGNNHFDHRLYLPEIYNLDLHQTELVILSACETAGGYNTSGEGLISLSRAFLYAGCDGIVSTLWKTEDQVSAYLMKKFHHYLSKNIAAEKALHLAKKDLLTDPSVDVRYKSPNYWSNFIYTGKTSSPAETRSSFVFIIAAVIIILPASWLVIKKSRQKPGLKTR